MSRPKGFHHSAETKEKQRTGNVGKHSFKQTSNSLKKISEASKRLWKNEWYRKRMEGVAKTRNDGWFKDGFVPWNKGLKLNPDFTGRCRFSETTRRKVKKESCVKCGSKEKLQLDHIVAVCNGGRNSIENCQVLCRVCNLKKRDTVDRVILQIKQKRANSAKS